MPDDDIPGGDFSSCKRIMHEEEGHDEQVAEDICGALQQEAKSDHGNPEELLDALREGAGLIADVGVDFNSAVDVPAINSKWVMMKSEEDGYNRQVDTPLVMKQSAPDTEKRISYAPAMIPREPDKEGDVVPTPTVEKAAHDYLTGGGEVDTDHNLIDGKGEVVESWIEPDERTWDLPDGGTETYPAGTWMVGIKWGADTWERIQNGELTGLSIYGMAEHVPLGKSAGTCAECGGSLSSTKSQIADTDKGDDSKSEGMGNNDPGDNPDGGDGDGGGGPTIGKVASSVESLTDTVSSIEESVKELEPAEKNAQEAAEMLADEYDLAPEDVLMAVEDMAGGEEKADDGEEDDDEESEKGEGDTDAGADDVEKRADDANLGKGGDSRTTAAKGIEDGSGGADGIPSYQDLADQHGGN